MIFSPPTDLEHYQICFCAAKKTGASVLISYNLSDSIPGVKEFVEKKIFAAISVPSKAASSASAHEN